MREIVNNVTNYKTLDLLCFHYFTVPSIILLTSEPSKAIPVGADVTLTCTVDLDAAVDYAVNVTTVLTGPDGRTLSSSNPVTVNFTRYTSTAIVTSFGRDESGMYNCTATVGVSKTMSSMTANFTVGKLTFIFMMGIMIHIMSHVGVYLSLKEVVHSNNSVILVMEIGEMSSALQCITDRKPCCSGSGGIGQWQTPTGEPLAMGMSLNSFFQSRGNNDGSVNLNRNSEAMSPTGQYCCVIPDATGVDQTLCANISKKWFVLYYRSICYNILSSY